jgi:hypothetical protein
MDDKIGQCLSLPEVAYETTGYTTSSVLQSGKRSTGLHMDGQFAPGMMNCSKRLFFPFKKGFDLCCCACMLCKPSEKILRKKS